MTVGPPLPSVLLLALVLVFPATGGAKESVVVMPLKSASVEAETVAVLDETLAVTMARRSPYEVVAKADIDAQLQREKMKDLLGCDDLTCAAEIGGALGARFLLTGSIRSVDATLFLTLSLIDTKTQTTGRGQANAPDRADGYRRLVQTAVTELLGARPAPGPKVIVVDESTLAAVGGSSVAVVLQEVIVDPKQAVRPNPDRPVTALVDRALKHWKIQRVSSAPLERLGAGDADAYDAWLANKQGVAQMAREARARFVIVGRIKMLDRGILTNSDHRVSSGRTVELDGILQVIDTAGARVREVVPLRVTVREPSWKRAVDRLFAAPEVANAVQRAVRSARP